MTPRKPDDDTSYRRAVEMVELQKKPISRDIARSALISRMKTQGTSADATDLLDEIKECLSLAGKGQKPKFESDLQARLIREVLAELQGGRMENFGFERLIAAVLSGLGAEEVRIIPRSPGQRCRYYRNLSSGVEFFQQVVDNQAKHWRPEPPVGRQVVEQLIRGMEARIRSARNRLLLPVRLAREADTASRRRIFQGKRDSH